MSWAAEVVAEVEIGAVPAVLPASEQLCALTQSAGSPLESDQAAAAAKSRMSDRCIQGM